MKIGIDISQIVYEGTGVARYTKMLIEAILKYDKKNEYIFFFSSLRGRLPQNIQAKIYRLPPTLLEFLWNRAHILPIENFIGKIDVFISSDWTQPPSKAKKITIVHDLVYLKYPETLPKSIIDVQKRRLNWVKKEVDLIITDSESTKKDLIELLNIPAEKIKVIYPAMILPISPIPPISLQRPFILTVAKLEPRKNIPRLINAFQKANLKDVDLVIVGPKGWPASTGTPGVADLSSEALAKGEWTPRGWTKQDNVKFLGFVPDSDLYSLYSKALFFIYPSLYEGFGYPVVEAMSLGCPVATSNTSSLLEIGKGAAYLFNPESEEDIKNAILKLYEDKDLRAKLSIAGKKRAADFSPAKFATDFLKILAF